MTIKLTSPAFHDGGGIPARYARDGADVPPPLRWSGIPAGTVELALVLVDPDAPSGMFVHWIVAGLDPTLPGLDDGARVPKVEGRNSWGEIGYGGPQPPPHDPPHRYVFTLYALAEPSGFRHGASHVEFVDAIRGKELTSGQLVGRYAR
ncbi:MAG TPA: YbhB/YbcL family Raf kinase inhibitor-like protein [Acidimicrobiales bacterium]